jgi:NAD(P)-dependent dehydrogenase (short-subunit alcohol dehydrogenase family)
MTWSLGGRPVIVTGANSGIGRAAAEELALAGAHVTLAGRNEAGISRAADAIEQVSHVPVDTLTLDLSDLGSVRAATDRFRDRNDDLALIVNNAGGMFSRRRATVDGHEMTFATNYLGPFLFTHGLLDLLCVSAPARIVNVGSSGHGYASDGIRFDDLAWSARYRMMQVYGHSKLATILHARELQRRFGEDGITAYSMHPGLVRTSIGRSGDSFLVSAAVRLAGRRMRTPEEGADTIVWLATADPPPEPRGGYFEDRAEARSTRHARDDAAAERLWDSTEELLGTEPLGCDSHP